MPCFHGFPLPLAFGMKFCCLLQLGLYQLNFDPSAPSIPYTYHTTPVYLLEDSRTFPVPFQSLFETNSVALDTLFSLYFALPLSSGWQTSTYEQRLMEMLLPESPPPNPPRSSASQFCSV